MALRTRICDLLDIDVPVVLAALGGDAGLGWATPVPMSISSTPTARASWPWSARPITRARSLTPGLTCSSPRTTTGGHNTPVGTMALIPQVRDAAGDLPLLAAGGIGDARGAHARSGQRPGRHRVSRSDRRRHPRFPEAGVRRRARRLDDDFTEHHRQGGDPGEIARGPESPSRQRLPSHRRYPRTSSCLACDGHHEDARSVPEYGECVATPH